MRVLFVYPNLYTQMGFNHGLASLSAVLKEAGHETRLVNLNENLPPVPTSADVVAAVRDWKPGLVGFSCLTMQYESALELARLLRTSAREEGFELPPQGLNFEDLERHLVAQALERAGGNQTRAAGLLGMNRDQIRYRIEKFGLRPGGGA